MRSACCLCLICTHNQVRPAGLILQNMAAVTHPGKGTLLLPCMACIAVQCLPVCCPWCAAAAAAADMGVKSHRIILLQ